MNQYNFPTTILSGEGALVEFSKRLKNFKHKKILIVTDETLKKVGVVDLLTTSLKKQNINFEIFSEVQPNPTDEDIEKGVKAYKKYKCDSIIALGGGSPMDAAKVIKIMINNTPPLKQYDDAIGGDAKITEKMPPLYAIPTTAGTGSEVGRSGVIILRETGHKTIFFHPELLPTIAVLEPEMTAGLPADITAATGIDAFSHCLEAYFAEGFHPMADGIALAGMELVLDWLPEAYKDGKNLKARECMLLAASMGATAFQKGLGMVHSLAHPLSSRCGMHHGLANALMIPTSIEFMENSELSNNQTLKLVKIQKLFDERNLSKNTLSSSCKEFFKSLGIEFGLSNHNVNESDLVPLSEDAYDDPCHNFNMIKVTKEDLFSVYKIAY